MKKMILFVIVFSLVSLKGFSLEKNVSLRSNNENPFIGEEITLSLDIDAVEEIYGFEVELLYDHNILRPLTTKVVAGEGLKDKNHYLAINHISKGKIRVMGTLLGEEEMEDQGVLFKFKVKPLKKGRTEIKAKKLEFVNINGKSIEAYFKPSNIKIKEKDNGSRSHAKDQDIIQAIKIQGPKEVVKNLEIVKTNPDIIDKNLKVHSNIYEITGDEKLNEPITITMTYKDQVDGEKLGIYYYNDDRNKWLYMGGSVEPQEFTISVSAHRLAKFGVFAHEKEGLCDLDGHWCKKFVKRLYLMGFMEGYQDGSFKPDELITRGEMAVVLSKAMDMDFHESRKFTDDHIFPPWARESIYAVAQDGLFTGYEDGSFNPNKYITRAELMTVIGKLLPHEECDILFRDAKEIPPWALKGIKTCTSHGIVQGNHNFIRPKENMTRGESAALIYNVLKALKI